MRLLFVADGRSPIALNWINYFIHQGEEVHLASTFPCDPPADLVSFTFIPLAFSEIKRTQSIDKDSRKSATHRMAAPLRTALRHWLGPLTIQPAARRLRAVINKVQPDLIHAMRIPYEGMLAATALQGQDPPLLVSIWGNDFTLHARATPLMAALTHRSVQRAAGLHTDCRRDVRLALQWGFSPDRPAIVLPGAGGVQADLFYPPKIPVAAPIVIQPRGFRAYVDNQAFFQAIPVVLQTQPEAHFLCPAMQDEPAAQHWVAELNVSSQVTLLPFQSRPQMADLFRRARVAVSPSFHDGTPNTLLEAMACGCVPVAGDLESLREWITPFENGLLVNPHDPQDLAQAILVAFRDEELQQRARRLNSHLIAERAEYATVMRQAFQFYRSLTGK